MAFAVGRRVGNAVTRNRLRRQLRTLLRENVPTLLPGAWLVAAAPGVAALDYDELAGTLTVAISGALAAPRRPTDPAGGKSHR